VSDIYCTICGEPWDVEELHFIAKDSDREFLEVLHEFRKRGCATLEGRCSSRGSVMSAVSRAAFEMMGDDVDGIVAHCEDYKDRR
jgi:hypothetical protein